MAEKRRITRRDWDGCYRELFKIPDYDDEEDKRLTVEGDLPDGVFAVERLVTTRKQKKQTVSLGARGRSKSCAHVCNYLFSPVGVLGFVGGLQ